MKATLFGGRLSPFVEKVARAMQLKGIEIDLVEPKSPLDFKKWNPQTGKMPVLELDGRRYYDSTIICRKLDEVVPAPPLVSPDAETAAKQRFIEDWSDESLYWYTMAFRWAPENERETVAQISGLLPWPVRPLGGILLPRLIGGQARAQGLARLPLATLVDELGRRLDELVVFLGDRPFFFSETVSVADLAVFGQLSTMKSGPTPQCEELIAARAPLGAFFRRVDEATQPRRDRASAGGRRAA